jgi:ketosteroid isomerase-like protein
VTNADLIKYVYEKFTQGDAQSLLAVFDDDMEFRLSENHPYQPSGRPWVGKDAIMRNFFMRAGAEWNNWRIDVRDIVETPDTVVVEGRYLGTYKPTGKRMDAQVCHVWKVKDGTVKSFHQYVDTAALHEVMDAVGVGHNG